MLFADRLEVWNPGELPPPLTIEKLRKPHASIPHNPLIAEPMFLTRYAEKAGSGILDMFQRCRDGNLSRTIRGIYDYPKHSERLGRDLSPNINQVARALARKFGWRIQAAGPAALNLLGLSTQVPGRIGYSHRRRWRRRS